MSAFQAFQSIKPIKMNLSENLNIDPGASGPSGKTSSFMEDEGTGKTLSFQNLFSQAVNGVNDAAHHSGDLAKQLVTGDLQSLHQYSIAGLKADILIKLATHVTSKMTQAATQLFQMQI